MRWEDYYPTIVLAAVVGGGIVVLVYQLIARLLSRHEKYVIDVPLGQSILVISPIVGEGKGRLTVGWRFRYGVRLVLNPALAQVQVFDSNGRLLSTAAQVRSFRIDNSEALALVKFTGKGVWRIAIVANVNCVTAPLPRMEFHLHFYGKCVVKNLPTQVQITGEIDKPTHGFPVMPAAAPKDSG